MDGFLRLINPADFKEFVGKYVEIGTLAILFAVTAFGDLLFWLQDGSVEFVSFIKVYREMALLHGSM